MQVRAIKTFQNKTYGVKPSGLVRTGLVLTVPERIATQWIRLKLVVQHDPTRDEKMAPGPDDNKMLDGPDSNKSTEGADVDESEDETNHLDDDEAEDEGKDEASEESDEASEDSRAGRQTGGKAVRSSSLRQGRRSRKKT